MKIFDFEQYSEDWWSARRGVPTASGFGKLLTPTGKPSTQAKGYMYSLIAECVTPEDEERFEPTEWMERGKLLEEEARDWYSMRQGKAVEQVGFILNDDGIAGCSPDGLISDDCGLEVKCPKASTHVGYLLNGKLPPIYAPQVHGSMWVTGFSKWIFISYHPAFRPLVVTVKRDDYTKQVGVAVTKFAKDLATAKARIIGAREAA
jgi:hypothetical protein